MKVFKSRVGLIRVAVVFLAIFVFVSLFFLKPPPVRSQLAGTLTAASATLANPRLSFYGKVNSIHTAGDTSIAIDTSDNADNDTNHLFPGDGVSVGPNGGMTVGSIIGGSSFGLTTGLTVGASDQATIYATQSGALTITFTITNDIPAGGYVRVLIPDPASLGNDGAPDTAASVTTNGFDLNGMAAATDIATTGGDGCTWSTETLTAGSGSSHKYKVTTTTLCTGGAIIVTFDGASKDLVNPAPITDHVQGTADIYTIDVDTYDGDPDAAGQLIDSAEIKVAPVEGVLVSATVDETLSFAITTVGIGVTACGQPADIATTTTSVPFGLLSLANTFVDLAHDLEVSTNANGGYSVKVIANDQMGLNGGACAGDLGEANDCIKDTVCDGSTCTHESTAVDDWETEATYGLGYSLDSSDGSDAAWEYDGTSGTCDGSGTDFCAAQFADAQASQVNQTIMSNIGPVSSKNIWVCYRISISNTQPAGLYYNKLKYTATAIF